MDLLARCNYEELELYKGRTLTTKIGNKKCNVKLLVSCNDFTVMQAIDVAKERLSVIGVEYTGSLSNIVFQSLNAQKTGGVYIWVTQSFGNNFDVGDLRDALNELPECVDLVIQLPEDFRNLRKLWLSCKELNRVHFSGGSLFSLDGISLGCVPEERLKANGVKPLEDLYADGDKLWGIEIRDASELEIEVSNSLAKKDTEKKSTTKPGVPKKRMLFSELVSSGKVGL